MTSSSTHESQRARHENALLCVHVVTWVRGYSGCLTAYALCGGAKGGDVVETARAQAWWATPRMIIPIQIGSFDLRAIFVGALFFFLFFLPLF